MAFKQGNLAMRLLFLLVIGLLLLGSSTAHAQSVSRANSQSSPLLTTEEVVEQFFPQRLIDDSEEDFARGGPAPFKTSTFEVADLNGDSTTFIVAAYSNGFSGVVRVLRKENGRFSLADEPNLRTLGGVFPFVHLTDIENDGRPEVRVSYTSGRGPTGDWVFKWDGAQLDLISPTRTNRLGVTFTKLSDSSLLDIDGDGVMEILNPTGSGPVAPDETEDIGKGHLEVYRFDGKKFIFAKSLNFVGSFFHGTGVRKRGFDVQDLGDDFVLTIINGMPDGKDRVSSAVIRLNGVVIVGPNDLNQEVGQIVREVSVLQDNVVEVELHGEAGGQVMITVEPPKD